MMSALNTHELILGIRCMLMMSALNTHDLAQLISIIYRVIITDYGAFWQVQ